jgi:hypothetical protein
VPFLLVRVLVPVICLGILILILEGVLAVRRLVQINLVRTLTGDVEEEVSVISQVEIKLHSIVLVVLMKADVSVVEEMRMIQIVMVEEVVEAGVLELGKEVYMFEN